MLSKVAPGPKSPWRYPWTNALRPGTFIHYPLKLVVDGFLGGESGHGDCARTIWISPVYP